jgi:hypothetical protein
MDTGDKVADWIVDTIDHPAYGRSDLEDRTRSTCSSHPMASTGRLSSIAATPNGISPRHAW